MGYLMRFDERVLFYGDKLNDTDDQIVGYVKQNRSSVYAFTLQKIADDLFTVPNTIMRFCRKMGYESFTAFKNEMKHEQFGQVSNGNQQNQVVLYNFELIDSQREDRVIKKLLHSRKIVFFAVGQTANICEIYARNFQRIDQKSTFYVDRHEVMYEIEHTKNTTFFFVSLTGETEQIIEMAQMVKAAGHTLISLTHLSQNRLEQLSDFPLYCYSPRKTFDGYNITDKTPLLIILESLFVRFQKFV